MKSPIDGVRCLMNILLCPKTNPNLPNFKTFSFMSNGKKKCEDDYLYTCVENLFEDKITCLMLADDKISHEEHIEKLQSLML